MRNHLILMMVLGLLVFAAMPAISATDDDQVTVTVEYVDLLQVPATAALTLTTATPGATAYDQGSLTQASGLLYSHNSTTSKKVTATAAKDAGNPANDVTLTAAIQDGAGATAVVSAGADQSGVLLWDAITADGYTKDLSWTVDGTLAGTKAGANINQNYIWTVTFTSADI